MRRRASFAFVLYAAIGVAYGKQVATPSPAEGWRLIAESQDANYSIVCTRGSEGIYSVFPSSSEAGYRVAREIWIKYGTDGRPVAITLLRGAVSADHRDLVTLGNEASCAIRKE